MSFRRDLLTNIAFDERLKGDGAQVHSELSLCLSLRRQGWSLLYDPQVAVDHLASWRPGGDQRENPPASAIRDTVHNETLALVEFFGWRRRFLFLVWSLLIGTRYAPGLAQLPRLVARREQRILDRFVAAQHGRLLGWRRFLRDSRPH
jgi:hypothetical protein